MSDILLVAVNSSFSHTNIAVRYLKYYSGKENVDFCEFTINQPLGEVLRGISAFNPRIVLFSTYIWNVEFVLRVAKNLKVLNPDIVIGAGGPEAGFRGESFLIENTDFDFVIKGEGEEVFRQISEIESEGTDPSNFIKNVKNVHGVYLREAFAPEKIHFTGEQDLLCDLKVLPFPYPDLEQLDVDHKIFYYESSRGCPFGCAYCMSSLDKKVRFVPLEKVFRDLQRFLDARVKLVKFVDRTYNLNSERYISIWKYLVEHHNGKTMFHFEIEGEFLSDDAIEFLKSVPKGIMQFEIGVQSSNPKVLQACGRSPEVLKLRDNIVRLPETIHTHLDLIAGLPYEDLESFGRSFDFVMNIEPDALQLGFLKVLYGAPVNSFCSQPGWKWMKTPPYEILETPYLSYESILFLKDLEIVLDAYWNDHNFDTVMKFLSLRGTDPLNRTNLEANTEGTDPTNPVTKTKKTGWWSLFVEITNWMRSKKVFETAHQKEFWAEMLNLWLLECETAGKSGINMTDYSGYTAIARELLRFDYISSGKKTNPPKWLKRNWDKDGHYQALQETIGIKNSRLDFAYSDFDTFNVNPFNPDSWGMFENQKKQNEFHVLFLYPRRESDNPSPEQRMAHQILL